jgi:cytochrome c peroxidase
MKNTIASLLLFALSNVMMVSCNEEIDDTKNPFEALNLPDVEFNYANQSIPNYITKDNTGNNNISDKTAMLGRVLFYDESLSENYTVSCASCHQQEHAFSDGALQSLGRDGGLTGRHSMRLVNTRFANEMRFFWDERATSLEDQTTKPIQDHVEMGFSGADGDPSFDDLIARLKEIEYYPELFNQAFNSEEITEEKIQLALAQFIRSIQSFDSKFDEGFAAVGGRNLNQDFPNFTEEENLGKRLFLDPPPLGGAGCAGCHNAPEFDIDPNSRNNGVIGVIGSNSEVDLTNTRSPSLRDLVNTSGELNGPFMHDGSFRTLEEVIEHYNEIPNNNSNTNLDPRLSGPPGTPTNQALNLTDEEKNALVAFLKTLTGSDVYTNEKWSDPFK